MLSLTYELNSEGHKDKAILDLLLSTLLSELHINRSDVSDMATRTEAHEVQLVILRLLSVLMSRTKVAGSKGSSEVSIRNKPLKIITYSSILTDSRLKRCRKSHNSNVKHEKERQNIIHCLLAISLHTGLVVVSAVDFVHFDVAIFCLSNLT